MMSFLGSLGRRSDTFSTEELKVRFIIKSSMLKKRYPKVDKYSPEDWKIFLILGNKFNTN